MDSINLKWSLLFILVVEAVAVLGRVCRNNEAAGVANEEEWNKLLSVHGSTYDFSRINSTHYRYCYRPDRPIKCCQRGEAYNGTMCVPFSKDVTIDIYTSNLRLKNENIAISSTSKNFCTNGSITTYTNGDRKIYILEDSSLYIQAEKPHSYHRDSYCVDNLIKNGRYDGNIACYTRKIEELNCHPNLTILTNGTVNSLGDLITSKYIYEPQYHSQINATMFRVCICAVRPCVRKCCPIGQYFINTTCTPSYNRLTMNVYDKSLNVKTKYPDELLYVIYGETCRTKTFLGKSDYTEVPYLFENGIIESAIITPEGNTSTNYTTEMFCIDNNDNNENLVAICLDEEIETQTETQQIYSVGFLISLAFLITTLLVYVLLPELQTIHGKNIMCHVSSLIVGYLTLTIVHLLDSNINLTFCTICAYTIQFSFLATFFWLNVMSFDIWLTFSNLRPAGVRNRKYKFWFYSTYAWGSPFIIFIISLVIDRSPNLPNSIIRPGFESGTSCFFESSTSKLVYFYGPIAVILICNCCLFASTARKICLVKKDTKVLTGADNRRSNVDNKKQRFSIYCKLFLIMGVTWITEVISWAAGGPQALWYFTDICNTLQGVFIFIICVGKKKIWEKIIAKFGCGPREEQSHTSTTAVSRLSGNESIVKGNIKYTQTKNIANNDELKS